MIEGVDSGWVWLAGGLALVIAEIVAPGFFLIWVGAAALLTGLAALAFGLPLPAELLLFAVAALGAVAAQRRWLARNPIISDDPLLNERTARLIGRTVEVVDPIVDGRGRVRVGDGVWTALGPNADVGARMRVAGAEGNCLHVEPIGLVLPG